MSFFRTCTLTSRPRRATADQLLPRCTQFFKSVGRWASGTAAQYKSGLLVEKTGSTDVAKGLPLGMVSLSSRRIAPQPCRSR